MLRSVYAKTIWDRRRGLVWWLVGLVALAGITVAFWPSLERDADSFIQLFENLPDGFLAAFGVEDAAELVTPVGFINSRLYGSIGTLIVIFFAISMGTQALAGEEDRGTMDLLLSHPIARRRIVLEKWLSMGTLTALLALTLLVVLLLSNPAFGLEFTMLGMLAANGGLALIGIFFGTLALAIGALTGNRGLTIGVSAGAAIATFFVHGLAPLVDSIAWTQKLSPFYWFLGSTPLENGFDPLFIGLLAGIAVALAVALLAFERRDVSV